MTKAFSNINKTVLIFLLGITTYAQTNQRKITVVDFDALRKEKKHQSKKQHKSLIHQANKLLEKGSFSVVNKKGIPPSKTKHDYMSIGPYWWPNPDTENGLPYIRKDGEVNPETRNNFTDIVEKNNFISAVRKLSKAYFFSEDVKYATKNIELITAWFIDEATRMNPNLNYGQSVPGRYDGRCFGIIEMADITEVIKFLEIAKEKEILDFKTEQAMSGWFRSYSSWLQNSELGKKEATRKNNHAVHYDAQLLNILIYLNRIEEVKTYLSTVTKERIFSQIEPDGSQPLELARTKSFSYSVMNLHGFLELAILGRKVEVNLWETSSKDGRSIKKAYQYMIPYLTNQKEWAYKQIKSKKYAEEKLIKDLKYIQEEFNDHSFNDVLEKISKTNKK